MTNVPRSVIQGKSPMKTDCSRISPVSRLMNATVIVSGRAKREVLLAHCSSDATGSSKVKLAELHREVPV